MFPFFEHVPYYPLVFALFWGAAIVFALAMARHLRVFAAAGEGVTGVVSVAPRADGSWQVTYDGRPLYYWKDDKAAGDTTGQGVNAFGAQWFALSGAGNQVTAQPSTSGGSSSTSGTPGY